MPDDTTSLAHDATNQAYWTGKHRQYATQFWIDDPTVFAQWALQFFPPSGHILELGGGQGQDARFFAAKGYTVLLTDTSDEARQLAKRKTDHDNIMIARLDITDLSPLPDGTFDVVYAHMALHYFTAGETERLFRQIFRVLKPGGIVATLVNSVDDPEYGAGRKLDSDYFQVGDLKKRFFSRQSMKRFARQFSVIALDNQGETYKERAKGISFLIRFVGKKE